MGGVLALGWVGLFLLGIGICHRAMAGGIDDRVFGARLAAAIAVGPLLVLGGALSSVVLVSLVALVLVVLVVFEWVVYAPSEPVVAGAEV